MDDELAGLFAPRVVPQLIIIAVSGGGDSMALMHLFARARQLTGFSAPCSNSQVIIATVDHGLRDESLKEAQFVARAADRLGFEHVILPWLGEKPASGLQNAAREARYKLLHDLSIERNIEPVAIMVAHHRDDQAETVLMRLGRGTGIDGLKGMRKEDASLYGDQTTIWRPLLDVPKTRLLATLTRDRVSWIEDPSNENADYERVRVRQARREREKLGLSDAALSRTARRLLRAHAALNAMAQKSFEDHVVLKDGVYCQLPKDFVLNAPEEIVLRVVTKAIQFVTSNKSVPNLSKLENLVSGLISFLRDTRADFKRTLGGCVITIDDSPLEKGHDSLDNKESEKGAPQRPSTFIVFYCEPGRAVLSEVLLEPGCCVNWGDRFKVRASQNASTSLKIRALDLKTLGDLRNLSEAAKLVPELAAMTLPSFWDADRLIYVPHLDYCVEGWREPLPQIEHLRAL